MVTMDAIQLTKFEPETLYFKAQGAQSLQAATSVSAGGIFCSGHLSN